MKLSIIRNLAVAALLSTTLISGAMAATIDATELDLTTGDVGKALAPLLLRPEAAALKAVVEDAVTKGTPLHSKLAKTALIDLIAKYEHGLGIKKASLRDNFFADENLDVAHIADLLVGKTAAQIEAEAVDHHWNAFLASDAGKRLAAKKDAEIRFGSKDKADAFLAAKPTKLVDAQRLAKEAEDYYAHDAALKRNIGEIGSLRSSLATSSISVSDVDAILVGLGITVADLGLPTITDGKAYLKAAFAAIKTEGAQFETALSKNTATMKQLRLDIVAASSHTPPPPPLGSPKGSPKSSSTSSHKKAYNPADFDGMPLLTMAEFSGMTDPIEQARLRAIFDGLSSDQKAAYERMAEPTRSRSRSASPDNSLEARVARNPGMTPKQLQAAGIINKEEFRTLSGL